MGFEDYVYAKYPGIIPPGRNRAWEVWDEPEEQLPNTQIAFKLLFPNLELAVRPEQKTSKEWKKEILYVDLRSRLPAGWMTVATVFVTRGNIRLQHEREPSIWLGSLEIGNGKWAQLVIHGDPELDVYGNINATVEAMFKRPETAGLQLPAEGFAYMLGRSSEGHRYIVGGRVNKTAQAERSSRAKVQFPVLKKQYHQFVMENKPTSLTFTYERSPDFSVRYTDGATIKPVSQGNLYIGFYIEHAHNPESITYEVTPDGALSKEISSVAKEGVCRQLQCAIVANPTAARAIANGIIQTLDRLDAADFVKAAAGSP
jgi:hypothetical protein